MLASLAFCLLSWLCSSEARAAFGDLITSYALPASSLVKSPKGPFIYATIPSQNSVAIINTNTLAYETVAVGSQPTNLAFSPDGSKAYITNSGSSFVVVLDTQTRTVIGSFLIPQSPRDVVFGSQNRLFVLTANNIFQIDATTGASTGASVSGSYIYGGSLEISPDRNTLYYGQHGLSPSRMYKFDISGATPALMGQAQTGSNGYNVTLSHDGSSICHPNGAPYQIGKYRTSDFALLGSFNTGAYPNAIAFSPDNAVAYASVNSQGGIQVFDASTFVSKGKITGPDVASYLATDSAGRYLFAGYSVSHSSYLGIRVYDTGRGSNVISAPVATAASNLVSSGFNANWNPNAAASGYRLDVSQSATFSSFVSGYQDRDIGDVPSFSVFGLNAGTTYYYRVRAYGSAGTSGDSNTISVVTRAVAAPAFGSFAAEYDFSSSAMVMSPVSPYMYATAPEQNLVAIINTNTLAVEGTAYVGSQPANLAFSPDGSKAYIANRGSNFLVVFDTQTRSIIGSYLVPESPRDVVFGNQNRLFVLGTNSIFQIDATTGASTGPNFRGSGFVSGGSLEISPDRNTLYYGQGGGSPSRTYKFDASGAIPVLLRQVETGSNGGDLTLSHDANSICHPNGAPYQIGKYRTSDFALLGSFDTGPYPRAMAFSPDDAVVYASMGSQSVIKVFDALTFLSAGTISAPEGANKLAVERSGRYVFAGYGAFYSPQGTRVYDTGRSVVLSAASRKSHGIAGNFDIPLPLAGTPGIECRIGGVTNDYTIVVTFAGDISAGGNAQAQVTAGSATIGSAGVGNGGAVIINGNEMTIPLTNVINNQTIAIRINGLPTGSTNTGSITIPMSIVVGDINGSGTVNSSDVSEAKSKSGESINGENFRADVTGNGLLNVSDIAVVKSNSGTGLARFHHDK